MKKIDYFDNYGVFCLYSTLSQMKMKNVVIDDMFFDNSIDNLILYLENNYKSNSSVFNLIRG